MLNERICFYQDSEPKTDKETIIEKRVSMLEYLQKLDPIILKYDLGGYLSDQACVHVSEFETQYQYSSITKQKYSGIIENLRLVYGADKLVENDIKAFHMVETRWICRYFGIPQLNQMFDEDYFNFEWDMHVGQNFSEHRSDYYRDHFIHQIRDFYMILRLLGEFGFYEASAEILRDARISKVSNFVCKKFRNFVSDSNGIQQRLLNDIHSMSGKNDNVEEYIEKFFFKYVVYASSMLSALFHDMGYPICHFLDVRRRISAYNPTMYMFTHNAVDSFDQLAFKLGSSLLFSVVSPQVIRKRLEPNMNGRYDHGAYSAIAFLLQFYDSGAFYSLSTEKQCAIELAALAIFNHTSKFKAINSKADTTYYNMYFRQNPISFMLRFCDDLQEWDRRYFEISNAGDLLFCPDCGFPLLKNKRSNKNGLPLPKSGYRCGCEKKRNDLFRPDVFIKRKLYLISVADSVQLSITKNKDGIHDLHAAIHYDLYKLLMLAKTNPTYAKYRANELNELKKLLADQDFFFASQGKLPFTHILLDYFTTANPILVKLKILETYLRSIKGPLSTEEMIELLDTVHNDQRAYYEEIIRFALPNIEETGAELVLYLLGNNKDPNIEVKGSFAFYYYLLRDCLLNVDQEPKELSNEVCAYLEPFQNQDPQYYDVVYSLSWDCINQYKNNAKYQKDLCKISDYIEDDKEEAFYQNVAYYTNDKNYHNHYNAPPINGYPYIGYFKDVFLFYCMNEIAMGRENSD